MMFLFFGRTVAQTDKQTLSEEEEEILDHLLLNEASDELQDILEAPLDFLYCSVEYQNKTYFSGRDIGIDQFNISPQITYLNSNGFFMNLSGVYYSKFQPKWDYTSVTIGYGKRFGKQQIVRGSVYYDRYFFSEAEDNPFKNGVNIGLELDNKKRTLGTGITTSLLFGSKTTLQVVSTSYAEINLLKNAKQPLKLRPELRLTVGKQTIQLARTFVVRGREITIYNENEDFGLLNTQLFIPLQYSLSNFDFELGYLYNIPSELQGESNLQNNGTFTVTIGYLFDL